jgi:hypothetical protein
MQSSFEIVPHYRGLYYDPNFSGGVSMNFSDAFLSGKLVDENGLPPLTAHYTVVTEGTFKGRDGYIRFQSDYQIDADGTFVSPPLAPGKYFLRFFGILQNPASPPEPRVSERRIFDFIYPNAETVSKASPFQVQPGETVHSVFQVPSPTWFDVAGRIRGNLPVSHESFYVMFQRDMGILPDVGGTGFPISADASFQGILQKGLYFVSVDEMTRPGPNGSMRSIGRFGSTMVKIEHDTRDLEIPLN